MTSCPRRRDDEADGGGGRGQRRGGGEKPGGGGRGEGGGIVGGAAGEEEHDQQLLRANDQGQLRRRLFYLKSCIRYLKFKWLLLSVYFYHVDLLKPLCMFYIKKPI